MPSAEWRVFGIFAGGVLALSVVNGTAARWLVIAVVVALLLAHANDIQGWISKGAGG